MPSKTSSTTLPLLGRQANTRHVRGLGVVGRVSPGSTRGRARSTHRLVSGQTDRRRERAVGRAVLVALPIAPNGLVSAASGPSEAQWSRRCTQNAGFGDGCRAASGPGWLDFLATSPSHASHALPWQRPLVQPGSANGMRAALQMFIDLKTGRAPSRRAAQAPGTSAGARSKSRRSSSPISPSTVVNEGQFCKCEG